MLGCSNGYPYPSNSGTEFQNVMNRLQRLPIVAVLSACLLISCTEPNRTNLDVEHRHLYAQYCGVKIQQMILLEFFNAVDTIRMKGAGSIAIYQNQNPTAAHAIGDDHNEFIATFDFGIIGADTETFEELEMEIRARLLKIEAYAETGLKWKAGIEMIPNPDTSSFAIRVQAE